MAHYLAEKKMHELWLRFLTEINETTEEVPQELMNNEFTREAIGYMEKAAYTKEQLDTYDKWKINAMTERGVINDAKIEGKIEIAINLLKKGMSIEDVSDVTGLSMQQIREADR